MTSPNCVFTGILFIIVLKLPSVVVMTLLTGRFVCTKIECIVLRLIELIYDILTPDPTVTSTLSKPKAVASF